MYFDNDASLLALKLAIQFDNLGRFSHLLKSVVGDSRLAVIEECFSVARSFRNLGIIGFLQEELDKIILSRAEES